MANEGEISVKIVADLEDIKKSLAALEKSSERSAKGIEGSFGSAAGKFSLFLTGINQGIELIGKISDTVKRLTVDLVIMGEKAAQVENGFRNLADAAGLGSQQLLDGILKANDGVVETTNLLARSSQLIVSFGKSAERLPEIIELSRKIAISFGIDAEEAFEKVTRAIVSGNSKSLKQLGLMVDSEKAVREFAAANGIAFNALTEVGRAQAVMNAALDAGRQRFASVSLSQVTVSDSFSRLNNSFQDFLEHVGSAIAETGVLQELFNKLTTVVSGLSHAFKQSIGKEQVDQVKMLQLEINDLTDSAEKLRKMGDFAGAERLESRLAAANEQMERLVKNQMRAASAASGAAPGAAASPVDEAARRAELERTEQRLKNEQEFQKQLNTIRLQNVQNAIKFAADEETLRMAQADREVQLEAEKQARIAEVNRQAKDMALLDTATHKQMLQEIENQHQLRLLEIERTAESERMMMLQTKLEMSQSVDGQIAVSAELQAARTSQAWRKSGQLGGAAVSAFSNRTMAAFAAVGAGTATMADAMKSAFFGMLGDVASAQGKTMFLTNLAPPLGPNPAGMAAGLGLIALGGLLSSMGGGGAKLGGGGGGGAGGGPEFGGFGGPSISDAQEKRKEVTINIEGNYFDSQETKLSIVEAVRSASDGNDFTIQRGNRR